MDVFCGFGNLLENAGDAILKKLFEYEFIHEPYHLESLWRLWEDLLASHTIGLSQNASFLTIRCFFLWILC
jgi:hypothetical protein